MCGAGAVSLWSLRFLGSTAFARSASPRSLVLFLADGLALKSQIGHNIGNGQSASDPCRHDVVGYITRRVCDGMELRSA